HQGGGVVRLDAPAIQDEQPLGHLIAEMLATAAADVRVNLLRLFRRGVPAGADRPNRFVGDHHLTDSVAGEAAQALVELLDDYGVGQVGVANVERLTDTENDGQTGFNGGVDLVVDERVLFVQHMTSFTVAEDHVVAADVYEHLRADLARE